MGGCCEMKYIIQSVSDGFQREFPHVKNVTFDNGWFILTDLNNIQWEFKREYHDILSFPEKGDWQFITDTTDLCLVENGIEKLKKKHPHMTFEKPSIKKFNGTVWITRVYELGTTNFYIIIL